MLSSLAVVPLLLIARGSLVAAARRKTQADIERAVSHFHARVSALEEQFRVAVATTLGDKALWPSLQGTERATANVALGEDAASAEETLGQAADIFRSADMTLLREGTRSTRTHERKPVDLLAIFSANGRLVYNAADETAPHDAVEEPILQAALDGQTSTELWTRRRAQRFLARDAKDELYLVVATPVERGDVIGAVLRGEGVTDSLIPELEDFSRGEVVVTSGGVVASDDLPLTPVDLPVTSEGDVEELELRGHRYLVGQRTLEDHHRPLGRAFLLKSYDDEVGAILQPVTQATAAAVALVLALSAVVAIVVAQRMSRPIVALEEGARRVSTGDFSVEVPRTTADEVGRLADQFNEMVRGLKQREQIKGLFKRYLNPQVVEELIKNPEKAHPGGERRTVTVLFSDLVDFTPLSESLDAEALVALLNGYFDRAGRALAQRGATLDKFIGDAIMCFWNAPLPQPDHAARACLAALDLAAVVDRIAAERTAKGLKPLQCRIGINTGACIVGNIGSPEAQDYTVIGDPVNLASRLEGAAKVYGTRTLVSGDTVAAAGGVVVTRELDLLVVKGKTQPVRVFELLGPAGTRVPEHAERFAEALSLYRAREFPKAAALFSSQQSDAPSKIFLQRCEAFRSKPPPEDWNGVHAL